MCGCFVPHQCWESGSSPPKTNRVCVVARQEMQELKKLLGGGGGTLRVSMSSLFCCQLSCTTRRALTGLRSDLSGSCSLSLGSVLRGAAGELGRQPVTAAESAPRPALCVSKQELLLCVGHADHGVMSCIC